MAAAVGIVTGLQEASLDDPADDGLVHVAEQVLVDEVARGGDEHQQRAGEHPWHRHREDHPPEGAGEGGVEVAGRVEEVRRDLLEAHVDRQQGEGQEVVDEPADDRRRGVEDLAVGREVQGIEQADEVQRLGDPEHRSVVGEERLPGDGPQQEAGEEGDHHQPEQQVAPAPDLEGDEVGQRVGQQDADDRGHARVAERSPQVLTEVGEGLREVAPLPGEVDLAAAARPGLGERDLEQGGEGDEEEEVDEDQGGRGQQVRRPLHLAQRAVVGIGRHGQDLLLCLAQPPMMVRKRSVTAVSSSSDMSPKTYMFAFSASPGNRSGLSASAAASPPILTSSSWTPFTGEMNCT